MPEEVASLAVGLVLNTGGFFLGLGTTLNSASSKLASWGMTMTALVSAPLIALVSATGRYATEFDAQMRNVNATLQLNEEQFKALRDRVIELSTTTRSTAPDIAASLLMISHAGIDAEEQWKLLEIATHAAGAAFTTTGQTSRYLIAMMRAYGLSISDASDLMDRAIFATQHGAGAFEQLTDALAICAPMAGLMGVSIEGLFGALRAMRMGGLDASEAAVSLQNIIRRLLVPTEKMKVVIQAAGYESGMMMVKALGLEGAIRFLTRACGGNIDKMAEMFGEIRAVRGMAILMKDDATVLMESVKMLGDSAAYEGAMERAREQQYKSLSAVSQRLKNTLMGLGLAIWEMPMPALIALENAIRNIALGFRDMSDQTKQMIVLIVGIGAALGPALFLLSKLLALGGLVASVALNPLTLALAAVAYAAYRWVTARYHIESLADAVVAFSDIASQALNWISNRLVGFVDLVAQMARWGSQAIGAFAQGIISGFGFVVQAINYVARGIAALLGPGSPPAILPDITAWGEEAINEFLRGMAYGGDYSMLEGIREKVGEYLKTQELLRVATLRVQAAEESLQKFREDTLEIPERFTRGRERQLNAELRAVQKEQAALSEQERAQREQLDALRNRLSLESNIADSSHAYAEMGMEDFGNLGDAIEDVDISLGELDTSLQDIDMSELETDVLGIGDALDGIKESTNAAKDAAKNLFGIWKAFWMGLTGEDLSREELKEMTDEEYRMYRAGEKVNKAWEKFTGALDKIAIALDPLVKKFDELGIPKEGVIFAGLAGIFGTGLLLKLAPTLISFGIGIGKFIIGGIFSAISGAAGGLGGITGGLAGIWEFLFAGATGAGELVLAIGVLLAIIAALIATIRFLWVYGKEAFKDLFKGAKGFVEEFLGTVDMSRWGPALEVLAKLWKVLVGVFELVGGILGTVVITALEGLGALLPFLGSLLGDFINVLGDLASIILGVVVGPLDILWTLFTEGPEAAKKKLLEWGDKIRKAVGNLVVDLIAMGVDLLLGIGATVVGILAGAAEGVLGIIEDLFGEGQTIFGLKLDEIREGIRLFKDDAIEFFRNLRDDVVACIQELVDKVVEWFNDLWRRLIGESVIPDIVNDIVTWFGKLPQLLWEKIEDAATRIVTRFIELKNKLLTETIPGLINSVVTKFSELPGKILTAIELGLADLYNRFVRLKDDIVGILGDLVKEGLDKLTGWVDGIISAGQQLYDDLVGESIFPDLVKDINASLGGLSPVLGTLTGLTPATVPATPIGGMVTGVQLSITNFWDASLSSKDRTELASMMEKTTYTALGKMYGGLA